MLTILGANGVGKTTLLNAIIGLRKPVSGRIAIGGHIGFVPQLFHAAFAYSVADIVLMGRARHIGLFGSPSAEDYRIARKYLAMMKVAELEHRAFNELSGGQRQLVMIAQALSSECEIMILDEPCSSLDYRNQSIVIEMLRTLNAEMGLTIVFTTHAPQHGLEIATDVLLMKDLQDLPPRPHARRADRGEPERPLRRADRQGRVCRAASSPSHRASRTDPELA